MPRGLGSRSSASDVSDPDSETETTSASGAKRRRTKPVPSVKVISNHFEQPEGGFLTPKPPVNASSPPLDKQLALKERERRWETLSPAGTQLIHVAGPTGVYELQEGIFLMCDDYSDGNEGRVS